MKNWFSWFEIPTTDFERAVKFYNDVFQINLQTAEMGGVPMAFFPHEGYGHSGSLVKEDGHEPGKDGVLVYFFCGEDLQPTLDRVEPAGGKIIMPKFLVDEKIGHIARFLDSEGNQIALHSTTYAPGEDCKDEGCKEC